ncbi:membrane-bound acid phosphatase [Novymonas esmeraldas]|uniref:Membrane-bound acid phosphatase n=1 Tax=Novymonas esmeraldas TaxID=1808958 RepID=A0AAW0EUV4_9TRYP
MSAVLRSLLPRRVRRLCVLAATTVLLAVACLPAPSHGSVEWVLQQVQVLHRHGSRSSNADYNQSTICGATPCGYLNPQGETMMRNVGAFLRDRYNNDATVVDTPFLPSQDYDLDVVSSRSTDVLRTLQSANRFLDGMFPNASRLVPAVHTAPIGTDVMLLPYRMPAVVLYWRYAVARQQARLNPILDAIFPDWTELKQVGAVLWSEGYCSDYKSRLDCAKRLYDIAAAKRSIGELPAASGPYYDKLREIIAEWHRQLWYYNTSDPFCVAQGGRGLPFLQQLLTNIDDNIAGRNTFKVMHYSAHDVTMGAVWGTLGDSSIDAMQSPFAQALVLELVKSASTGEYAVRVLRGWPGQSPDTDFAFSWDPTWKLQCRRSDGTSYVATDNMCPLEDFRRYVAGTVGTDPRGMCLLDADTTAVLDCPTTAAEQAGAVTLSPSCALYRTACPAYSCPSGYVLAASSSRCMCASSACLSADGAGTGTGTGTGTGNGTGTGTGTGDVHVTVQTRGVSGGAVAGIAIATFSVGALVAVAVTLLIVLVLLRRRNTGSARSSEPSDKYAAHGEHRQRDM